MKLIHRDFIYESRDINSRSTWDYVYNNVIKSKDGGINELSDLFLTFTSVDKVGINPKSSYGTPNGIYCYSLEYYNSVQGEVPFESNNPKYVTIFKCDSSKMLKIGDLDESEYNSILEKLIEINNEYKIKLNETGYINTGLFEFNDILEHSKDTALIKTFGGILWNTTRLLSIDIAKFEKLKTYVNIWSRLFIRLGYIGVIDECSGIIHANEKCQAVVFSNNHINVIDRTTYRKDKLRVNNARYGTFDWLYSMYITGYYVDKQAKFIQDYMNCIKTPDELSRLLALKSELIFSRIFARFKVTNYTMNLIKGFSQLDFNRIGRYGINQLLKIPFYFFTEESPKDILIDNIKNGKYKFNEFDDDIRDIIKRTIFAENDKSS